MGNKLLSAFMEKAKAEQYLANLEKLKDEGNIESAQYDTLKTEYSRLLQDAQSRINNEKAQFQKVIDDKKAELAAIKLDLKYLEIRHKVGEISIDTFNKKAREPQRKIAELESNIGQLEQIVTAPADGQITAPPPPPPPPPQPEQKKKSGFSFGFGKKKEKPPVMTPPPIVTPPVMATPPVVTTPPVMITPPANEAPVAPAAAPWETVNAFPPTQVAQTQPQAEPVQPVEEAPEKEEEIPLPPGLIITNLDILPSRVAAGNHVGIVASLKNTSASPIQHHVELRINSEVKDYRDVFLPPGKTEEITFMILTNYDGEYKVDVGGQIGKYTVLVSR
jgi:hypothetical protein